MSSEEVFTTLREFTTTGTVMHRRGEYQGPRRPNDGHGWATHICTGCPDEAHLLPRDWPRPDRRGFYAGHVHFTGNTDNQSSLVPGGPWQQFHLGPFVDGTDA
jgi:hypothetical protein